MLTPMDIHNKEFKRGFRGYSEEDVDAFMDNIADDYEKVYREYCEIKEKCEKLQDKLSQYEKMESTMNRPSRRQKMSKCLPAKKRTSSCRKQKIKRKKCLMKRH